VQLRPGEAGAADDETMSVGRILLYGSGISGFGVLGYKAATNPDGLDPNNIGVVRFGRAAVAVGKIGLDYKKTLGSQRRKAEAAAIATASLNDGSDVDDDVAKKNEDEYNEALSQCHIRSANVLLRLCQANGGCFIKVGQHIGALDYLLPEEYVSTMKVLHNRAPEMKLTDVYKVIREDLKQEPEEIFTDFEERPLGTASLAQVHKAKTQDGQEVAVKVQHRFVKNHSFVDIYTMDFLVHTVKFFFPQFEFMWLAEEMRKNLPLELSFIQEGKNSEKVANLLSHFDWLKIPKIFWKYSTDRVLVMEYCDGTHIDDVENLRQKRIDLFGVSRKISQMYADMIFKFGYVHCDPHPGNVMVRKNSKTGQDEIVLLDHGLYSQLTNEFRLDYSQFWLSILNADTDGIKQYADKLGVGQLYGLFACMVAGRSWDSITKGIDRTEKNAAESKEIKENVARYIKEIADVLAFVNRQMILIFKTNDLLRTIEFNLGTASNMSFFVHMSRACFRCLNAERVKNAKGGTYLAYPAALVRSRWDQLKISVYQIFLWLYFSRLGAATRKMLAFS